MFKEKRILIKKSYLGMAKKTMPICFDVEQYKTIEKYAKKYGMLHASQAIEKIVDEI